MNRVDTGTARTTFSVASTGTVGRTPANRPKACTSISTQIASTQNAPAQAGDANVAGVDQPPSGGGGAATRVRLPGTVPARAVRRLRFRVVRRR